MVIDLFPCVLLLVIVIVIFILSQAEKFIPQNRFR